MEYIIILVVIVAAVLFFKSKKTSGAKTKAQDYKQDQQNQTPHQKQEAPMDMEYLKGAYGPRWLFTYNEKDAYNKLCAIAEKHKLRVFAKVRLFDLVEPTSRHPKYKTNLYRIQAKHVDFVLTSENLVAKYIIELDDNSHNAQNRKNRDEFVDNVLTACGYKVLHTRNINEPEIEAFIKG